MGTVVNARRGKPRPGSYKAAHRVAGRYAPRVASSFVRALARLNNYIATDDLLDALASGNPNLIVSAIAPHRLAALFLGDDSLESLLHQTAATTGRLGAEILADATGLSVGFNAVRPDVVLFARRQSATLVVAVTEDVAEAIRIVIAAGALEGIPPVRQAVAIRQVVGLPPNWAMAPTNLARELREGRFTSSRRLSGADKQQIRSRLARGTMDEDFIATMQARYRDSLISRRAQNIAQTETMDAAHNGLHQSWRQAVEQGVLPDTARRHPIVTLDDRLRPTHAAIPGMNPDGVGMDQPFDTPFGARMNPPFEPNCRCGVGLSFPGQPGVL